jgi:hypothetical protein
MTARLYQDATALFASYPLAVKLFANSHAVMVLVDGENTYTLHHGSGRKSNPQPFVILFPWDDRGDQLIIGADGNCEIHGDLGPAEATKILARATPFPRDGSLLGWVEHGMVTALVACYADADLNETGRPSLTLMPRCDVPPGQWPPLTADVHSQFGEWFWEHARAGRLVSLASLIASHPGAVIWVENATPLGTSICTVTRDIASPDGYTLPVGHYAYYKALQQGMPNPHLLVQQGPPGIDLAPRFRRRTVAGAA